MDDKTQKYQPHDDRKRAIASAVRALIVEKGFSGLRTRDIAERVGINIATLHYHVPSKEALIELVTTSMRDDFVAQHLSNPREGLTPAEELRLELNDFRSTKINNPDLLVVMEELARQARHDENLAKHMRPLKVRWRQMIVDILSRGVADGTFRADMNPEAAAQIVIAALIAFDRTPASCLKDQFDAVADELFRAFLARPIEKDTQ